MEQNKYQISFILYIDNNYFMIHFVLVIIFVIESVEVGSYGIFEIEKRNPLFFHLLLS